MIVTQTIQYDVRGEVPITETAIEDLRYEWRGHYVDDPELLVLHPASYNEFLRFMEPWDSYHDRTFHGLGVMEDTSLEPGGWLLRRSTSTTESIKT